MQNRKSWFAAATVSSITLAAAMVGAQTFEQSVNNAVSKDNPLYTQTSDLKASVNQHSIETQQAIQQFNDQQAEDQKVDAEDVSADRGGGQHGGGQHGGNGGRGPGGNPGRNPGRDPGRGPGREPGRGPGREPGRGPGHDHPHQDWGHYHGHPGWGYGHPGWRWGWDPLGRPIWWVWGGLAAWNYNMHVGCWDYYHGYLGQCYANCGEGQNACASACYGNPDCIAQCSQNTSFCDQRCDVDFGNYRYGVCRGQYWP
jgi:hypothetical protein